MVDDHDLLTPSLTAEDDTHGLDRPWEPIHLVILSFFFGILSGGVLLALNFKKLGKPHLVVPTLAAVVAVFLVSVFGQLYWIDSRVEQARSENLDAALQTTLGGPDSVVASEQKPLKEVRDDAESLSRWVLKGVAIVVGLIIARLQRHRFALVSAHGLPQGKLLIPAIIASVGSVGLQLLIWFGWLASS